MDGLPLNTLLAQQTGSFWLPPRASTTAASVDWAFYFVFYTALVFFVLIVAVMLLFVIRYRRRPGVRATKTATHSTVLELTWTGIPIILVIVMFATGLKVFVNMTTVPGIGREINVTAHKWAWEFQYSNGYIDTELHVPVDEPVRLVMNSLDVIHSLYVPAFRTKMDVVPGRYSKTWFKATQVGEFDLYCAEYCGAGHSDMITKVIVHPAGGFDKWLEEAGNWVQKATPVEAGKILVMGDRQGRRGRGCSQCHRVDGQAKIGPPLNGLFGTEQTMKDGSKVLVDENYIRESILEPQAKVVAGYEPVMPTYKGRLKEEELSAIIAYLKSLRDK
jgi:cytochrome c oxidase subunit 2